MGMRSYSRAEVTRRLFNAPLQVLPDTAAIVMGVVGRRYDVSQLFFADDGRTLDIGELEAKAKEARIEIESRFYTDQLAPACAADDLMPVLNGVAFVEVRGELVSENGISASSGLTGYDGIRAKVLAADADANVGGILLDISSPGGEVDGLYECAKSLMGRRGNKPMRAVVRGCGASAAYALAACADEITLNPLGIAGSIGTIAMHADFSKQLEQEGIKVTLIMAGAHKADGNPFEPLPPDVRDQIAAMVNMANDQFIAHVAAARGLTQDAVRAQQAQIYRGAQAIGVNLVDKVMAWDDSIAEFTQRINRSGPTSGGLDLNDEGGDEAPPQPGGEPADPEQETIMPEPTSAPAAAATTPEFTQATQDAAVATAVTAERSRVAQLAELDDESTVSEPLNAAIAAGTSAGDFAIQRQKAAREAQAAALTGARADAAAATDLPNRRSDSSATATKPNRGEAAVNRLRGKISGLPATA